jgi:hypothetical protein
MKKLLWTAGAAIFCATLFPALPAEAVSVDGRPKILLHVKATTTKNPCVWGQVLTDCSSSDVVTSAAVGAAAYYNAYVLVHPGDETNGLGEFAGLAGTQFGIEYGSGIEIFGWTLCAALEFPMPSPTWPASGGGNLITWDPNNNCQRVETSVAGFFYMGAYQPTDMQLTVRPVDSLAKVADCSASEFELVEGDLGMASFGGGPGLNPCAEGTPVQATTWSGVKTLLGREND